MECSSPVHDAGDPMVTVTNPADCSVTNVFVLKLLYVWNFMP